jgi:hypothetical protein
MDVARRLPAEAHRRRPGLHIHTTGLRADTAGYLRIVVPGDWILFERDYAAPVGPAGCHGFVSGLRAAGPAVRFAHTVANCADRFLDREPTLSSRR